MLTINNLSFGYTQKEAVIRGLNLSLNGGDVLGLLGKNGAGKTTLLNLMSGLLVPDGGYCQLDGQRTAVRRVTTLADIFYLPEQNEWKVGVSGDRYCRAHAPFYPRFDTAAYARYCREFEVDDKKSLHAMSMGDRKKFFIAFGLATNCRLLLLDEALNGLDIPAKECFRRLVAEAAQQRRAVVLSTHQVREVEDLINPVAIIDGGDIIFKQSGERINDKLTVDIVADKPANALYTQPAPGGFAVLRERDENQPPRRVDLEMLFAAATSNALALRAVFEQ